MHWEPTQTDRHTWSGQLEAICLKALWDMLEALCLKSVCLHVVLHAIALADF